MTRVGWDGSRAFCPSISGTGARMTRPSPPASAPWRSPRPVARSSCRRWRTSASASPTMPRATITGAIDCLGQTVASLDGARRHERFGQVQLPAVLSRAYLASCHAELGMFAEGRAFGDEGLRIAEAVAHPGSLMRASWGIGVLALRQGDLPRALPLLERAVSICHEVESSGLFPLDSDGLGRGVHPGRARR